jgi:hypothetical protein
MQMSALDWKEVTTQRQAWRKEIVALKEMVARAEAETRAEFNILLATVSAEQPEVWERLPPESAAAAREVEVQLQDWGLALRELKVAAVHAEVAAIELYDGLLIGALVSGAVGCIRHQAAWATGTTRVICCHQERGVDIITLRIRAARAAIEVIDAYWALLSALRANAVKAREKRRKLFSLPAYY